MTESLLPSSASQFEVDLSESIARIGDVPVNISDLWNPDLCPLNFLPWLAWSLSVDWWDDAWSEEIKRKVVKSSIAIHRHKGTPWAVKEYLKILGYRDAKIFEGVEPIRHDGKYKHNRLHEYASPGYWALFRVVCDLGNDMGLDASTNGRVVSAINAAKNLRSHLYAVGYRITLSDENAVSRSDSLLLRVGLQLTAQRPAVRDGSILRSVAGPWTRDGSINHNEAVRSGSVSGPFFGLPRFACPVKVGLQIESKRTSFCPRDGSVRYSVRSRNSGAPYEQNDFTTIRQVVVRDGSRARAGQYGARIIKLSTATAFPARNGRFCRDESIRHCHTYMEAIA